MAWSEIKEFLVYSFENIYFRIIKLKKTMFFKKVVLLPLYLLVLSSSFSGKSEHYKDSLKNIWSNKEKPTDERFNAIDKYYRAFTLSEPDTVLVISEFHYNLASKINSYREVSNALSEKSFAYYIKGDAEKSMVYLKLSIDNLAKTNDTLAIARMNSNLGNLYFEKGDYQEALIIFSKNLKVFREHKKVKSEADLLTNMGLIFSKVESYDLAMNYVSKALTLYDKMEGKGNKGFALMLKGLTQHKLGMCQEALKSGKKALQILETQNNKASVAECYFLFAQCHKEFNQPEEAVAFINESLATDSALGNKNKNLKRLIFKSNLLLNTNLERAREQGEQLLKSIDSDVGYEIKADLYYLLYECYKKLSNSSKSLLMYESHILYSDSLENQKSRQSIVRKAIQQDFEEKISVIKLQSEKERKELNKNFTKKTYLIIGVSIVVLLLILLYINKIIQSNKKIREGLLNELDLLKNKNSSLVSEPSSFSLNKDKIEEAIQRKLNETDWKVLNVLLSDPVMTNKEIAEKVFLSVPGISSSLRRMYEYFEIKESKYMKISLLMEAIKLSHK